MPKTKSGPVSRARFSEAAKSLSRDLELLRNDRSLSEEEFWKHLSQAVTKYLPDMTKRERSEMMDKWASLLYSFDQQLAFQGTPRPGNNPQKAKLNETRDLGRVSGTVPLRSGGSFAGPASGRNHRRSSESIECRGAP
jgi:hypothetical protein